MKPLIQIIGDKSKDCVCESENLLLSQYNKIWIFYPSGHNTELILHVFWLIKERRSIYLESAIMFT